MGPILRFLKRLAGSERRATRPTHSTRGTAPHLRRLIAEPLEQRHLLAIGLGLGTPPLASHGQTLADLPGAAQEAISSAIGQDQPAYQIASATAGASLANRANGFTAQLQAGLLQVSTGANNWDMSLVGLGYGGAVQPLGTAQTAVNGNRVDCNYGTIDEWYVNGPGGLEQGFYIAPLPQLDAAVPGATSSLAAERSTIAQLPQSTADSLTVQLALGGDLRGTVNAAGDALTLTRPDGSAVLGYTGLTACDAAGKTLPASLEVRADQGRQDLLIHVDTFGAQGPITIDPLLQTAELTASDGAAGDLLGSSVAISGNTVVVGAPDATIITNGVGASGQGAAYVFTGSGSTWTQTAKLTASDGAARDHFGASVSFSGNTLVIGAPNATVGASGQGAAYVFTKPVSGWANMTQTAKLTASDRAAGDAFGSSVSIDGNTAVVGTPNAKVGAFAYQGAAYVFTMPGSAWVNMTQTAKLTASDGAAGDAFGNAVSISGATVVAGAPKATVNAHSAQGAAYIFAEGGSGWANMTQQSAKLTASDGAAGDAFGQAVSISGNTVLAGAPINASQGAAYVFTGSGASWSQAAKLTASDGAAYYDFGVSVSISGSTLAVGADAATDGGNSYQGAAYVFTGSGANWTRTPKLTASNGAANDRFGAAVAISGSTLVVGVPDATVGGKTSQGAAYVFGNPVGADIAGLDTAGEWWMAKSTGSSFVNQDWGPWGAPASWSNVQVGDVNGDGLADIVGMTSSGVWSVALNSGTGFNIQTWGSWNPTAGWTDVHMADVNGDGKADIVGRTSSGDWWVAVSTGTSFINQYWGSWNPAAGWQDVHPADVNGDGKADIVGRTSWGDWYAAISTGTSFLNQYWCTWNSAAGWTNVQVADVNGDGKADVVGRTSSGDWWVALSTGTSFLNQYWGNWNPAAGWTNVQVADVNGDGKADLVGRTSSGDWWMSISTGTSFVNQYSGINWAPGNGWQDVQVADVNGDGKADVVGMQSSGAPGDWYVALSTGTSFVSQNWGLWNYNAGWPIVLVGQFG